MSALACSRLVIAAGVALSTLAVAEPAAAAPSGPVLINSHTSAFPPEVWAMSSSPAGTVYSSDRTGRYAVFFRPAPMSSGVRDVALGRPDTGRHRVEIVGDSIAIPLAGDHVGGVSSVEWCRVDDCSLPRESITLGSTEVYLTNAGTGVLVYDTNGSRRLRIKRFGGGFQYVGTLPQEPFDPESVTARADAAGAVVSGASNYDVHFATATVTTLEERGSPVSGSDVAISPAFVAVGRLTVDGAVISRFRRDDPGGEPMTFVANDEPDTIQALVISDTATAWLMYSPLGQTLSTRRNDSPEIVRYVRELTSVSLARYEGTDDFLVADRTAPTAGFYRVEGGEAAGVLSGDLGQRLAVTGRLALSHNRVLFGDDSLPGYPSFIRDVAALPELGGETTVATETLGEYSPGDVSGPFVAFARRSPTEPDRTDIVYGRPGSVLAAISMPAGERVYAVEASGHRALIEGSGRPRLLNLLTGQLTVLEPRVSAALWGDYLVTLELDTARLQRRNLVSGVVAVILPADPECDLECVDDEHTLGVWGNQVAFRFRRAGSDDVNGVWTATSESTGTIADLPAGPYDLFRMSDGLLLATERPLDRLRLHDLRAETDAIVGPALLAPFDLDGYRLGWLGRLDGRPRVADVRYYLPDYALSAPRLMSRLSPAGFAAEPDDAGWWTPRFYVSREVTWRLELRSPAGAVVRVINGSSALGEITPAWDGTDGFGSSLPQGTYGWTLTGSADGLPLSRPDGSAGLVGRVYLGRTPPEPPAVTAPARSTDTSATTDFEISWASPGAPPGTRYTVRTSVDGGAYTTLLLDTTATVTTVIAAPGETRRFSVMAKDPAGRVSTPGLATTIVPYDDASTGMTYTGSWAIKAGATRYLGAEHTSATVESTVSFSAIGRRLAVIGSKGPATGEFQISYDGGAFSDPIDTTAPTFRVRQLLVSKVFSGSPAVHRVTIRVVGTAGRPTVAIDGIGYLR